VAVEDSMLNQLSTLAGRHWVIGGVLTSLLWFAAGKQSLSHGKPRAAIFWQGVGVIIMLILFGWTIKEEQWLGLAAAIIVLLIEIRSVVHIVKGLGSS